MPLLKTKKPWCDTQPLAFNRKGRRHEKSKLRRSYHWQVCDRLVVSRFRLGHRSTTPLRAKKTSESMNSASVRMAQVFGPLFHSIAIANRRLSRPIPARAAAQIEEGAYL